MDSEDIDLTHAQGDAVSKYARQSEQMTTHRFVERRVIASESIRRAKAAIGPPPAVVMDWIAVKGRTFAELSAKSGRSVEDLHRMFLAACDALVRHYQGD